VNPRGQVPAIVHDGFALFESSAICAYLDDVWRERPLLPEGARERAVARRLIAEIDGPFHTTQRRLLLETLYRRGGLGDPALIAESLAAQARELERFEAYLTADYLAGPSVSLADYTFYPFIANVKRIEQRYPQLAVWSHVGARIRAWAERIEALPYFERTTPPHWKE
jgi:glutathione S-transferase